MRKCFTKNFILLSVLSLITTVSNAERKRVYVVGDQPDGSPGTHDQLLIDSLNQYVDAFYVNQATFNGASLDTVYEGLDGVVFSESIGSNTVGNFGARDQFPVPSITLEAGVLDNATDGTKWSLMNETGGTWGYGGGDAEAVELQWKISDELHPIIEPLGYKMGDIITWSEADPTSRGIAYKYGIKSIHKVIALAARTEPGSNTANASFDPLQAVTIAEFEIEKILFISSGKSYYEPEMPTQAFFDVLRQGAYYMFDAAPVAVEKIKNEAFNLTAYPNPAQNTLNVDFRAKSYHGANVSLINLAGQTVLSENFVVSPAINRENIDISNVPGGVYMVKLEINNQATYTKVVVE